MIVGTGQSLKLMLNESGGSCQVSLVFPAMITFPHNKGASEGSSGLGQGHTAVRAKAPFPALALPPPALRPLIGPLFLHLWLPPWFLPHLLPSEQLYTITAPMVSFVLQKSLGLLQSEALHWVRLRDKSALVPAQRPPSPVGKTEQVTSGPLVERRMEIKDGLT